MSDIFNLMLITNIPDVASYAEKCGVTRIFIDLEINGKYERQGHLDTVISHHSINDITKVKSVLNSAKVLVRINPLFDGTKQEIDDVISAGAEIIMLPMFKTVEEINFVINCIAGRVDFIPLVETREAKQIVEQVAALDGVSEIYIGLNDLHRSLGMSFIFEPLLDGSLDEMIFNIKKHKKKFGFGGISRVGSGELPSELVIGEHVRLGSSCVIISRSFHLKSVNLNDFIINNFEQEIINLKCELSKLRKRTLHEIYRDKIEMQIIIGKIIGVNSEKVI